MFNLVQLMSVKPPRRQREHLVRMPSAPHRQVDRSEEQTLSGDAQAIADVIGTRLALYLIGQLPRCLMGSAGRKSMQPMLYVPKMLNADHLLVRLLGLVDAQALVDACGGECLKPSGCTEVYRRFRDREILSMLAEGCSRKLVADAFGVNERLVRGVLEQVAA